MVMIVVMIVVVVIVLILISDLGDDKPLGCV